jgi:hypothetical protein
MAWNERIVQHYRKVGEKGEEKLSNLITKRRTDVGVVCCSSRGERFLSGFPEEEECLLAASF